MAPATIARHGLLLAVTGVSLYLLGPALLEVFGAFDQLEDINPLWFAGMLALQVGSYASMWWVQRLALRVRRLGPVITSQLASNAFGRLVPGGVAAASGMTASSILVFGTLLALPLLAVPAIVGGAAVDPNLVHAAIAGAVVFVAMFAVGAACIVWDRPLQLIGRGGQAIRNRVLRRRAPLVDLPERLIRERDVVLTVLGRQWWRALLGAGGRWVLDYLTLLAALYAVGSQPRASLVLLAFFAAQLLGTLPLTPGGLGFVEAGLTGTLALAGVSAGAAVVATLAYRLVSFWLPIPAGGVAAIIHGRLYGTDEEAAPAESVEPTRQTSGR